jgi:hypothetical protein
MIDETENIRRSMVQDINSQVQSDDKTEERKRLEGLYGRVWDTDEVRAEFEIIGFMAPFVVAKRKKDNKKGSLEFQHSPRFYFNWKED